MKTFTLNLYLSYRVAVVRRGKKWQVVDQHFAEDSGKWVDAGTPLAEDENREAALLVALVYAHRVVKRVREKREALHDTLHRAADTTFQTLRNAREAAAYQVARETVSPKTGEG